MTKLPKKVRRHRPVVGDTFEALGKAGNVYFQMVHQDKQMGPLVRVFNRAHQSLPDISSLVKQASSSSGSRYVRSRRVAKGNWLKAYRTIRFVRFLTRSQKVRSSAIPRWRSRNGYTSFWLGFLRIETPLRIR